MGIEWNVQIAKTESQYFFIIHVKTSRYRVSILNVKNAFLSAALATFIFPHATARPGLCIIQLL